MQTHFDETMPSNEGKTFAEIREKLRARAIELFDDSYNVTVTFNYASKSDYAVMMSSCSVVVLNRQLEPVFIGQLEYLQDVVWIAPRFLSPHKIELIFSETVYALELVTAKKSEPSLVERLKLEIRRRNDSPIPFAYGFPGTPTRDDVSLLSVDLHGPKGELLPAISELMPRAKNDFAMSMMLAFVGLLHWEVDSGDFVQEGQIVGQFCDIMMKAPASGRIWITAPSDMATHSPQKGESTLAAHLPSPTWIREQHEFWDFRSIIQQAGFSHSWNVAVVEHCELPSDMKFAVPPVMQRPPDGILIRQPADAERSAAMWMRYWGWIDAQETGAGTDGGKDAVASDAIAQVKAHMNPIGRPDLQNLFGVAASEGKQGLFFSLMGYTAQALEWAEEADLPLFRFDLQGAPEPVNGAAIRALQAKQDEWRDRAQEDEDADSWDEDDEDDDNDDDDDPTYGDGPASDKWARLLMDEDDNVT